MRRDSRLEAGWLHESNLRIERVSGVAIRITDGKCAARQCKYVLRRSIDMLVTMENRLE